MAVGVKDEQLQKPLEHTCPFVGSHVNESLHAEPIPAAYVCAVVKFL
jgi:hypothetical protein